MARCKSQLAIKRFLLLLWNMMLSPQILISSTMHPPVNQTGISWRRWLPPSFLQLKKNLFQPIFIGVTNKLWKQITVITVGITNWQRSIHQSLPPVNSNKTQEQRQHQWVMTVSRATKSRYCLHHTYNCEIEIDRANISIDPRPTEQLTAMRKLQKPGI